MSQDELAAAVGRLGRSMTRQIVGKTEAGDRRVDLDDLIAFAIALGVTPGRLLLPGTAGPDQVDLLPGVSVSEIDAWKWVTAEEPLPADDAPPGAAGRFLRENRPHAAPDGSFGTMHLHRDLLDAVIRVARMARERGIPLTEVKFNLDHAYVHALPDDEQGSKES